MALSRILGRRDQIVDNEGRPLAAGLVNLYEPNTATRITSYKAADVAVENDNPVKLSGAGRADIWVTRNCDIRITDKDGNLVSEELNVNPDDLGGTFDSGLVPNGSFETDADADNVPDSWSLENEGGGSNNAIDSSESTDGGQCFRFQGAGAAAGELVTDAFFPVNDADDLRVNFDIRSTVAGVRNIVRVEWYDISQVSISNSDVYDSTANPTAWTSQVLTATPPANARFAKLRLFGVTTGGTLTGITRFDRLQVFYPEVVSGVFDNITISGNDIISTNTNGNVNITPNGTGDTVVKNLSAINGGELGTGGESTVRSAANGLEVADTGGGSNPVISLYDDAYATLLGFLSHDGADLNLRNLFHGGRIRLQAEDAGGTLRSLIVADPDTLMEFFHTSAGRVAYTHPDGLYVQDPSASSPFLGFANSAGDRMGYLQVGATGVFLRSESHGDPINLEGENIAGTARSLVVADPDAGVEVYYAGGNVVALDTVDYTAADAASAARVRGPDGTLRYAGFNTLPRVTLSGGNLTLAQSHQGSSIDYVDATNRSLNVNNVAAIPADAYFHVRVARGAGTLTLNGGTGVTMEYWDGVQYQITSAAGDLELGEGSYTIHKETDTNYVVDGPNITAV